MPQILVRGLNQATVKRLEYRARINGRSLEQEVKEILERAARTLTMEEAGRLSGRWHRRFGRHAFSESAELVREDRDSR
jgi:antitoxin FitA